MNPVRDLTDYARIRSRSSYTKLSHDCSLNQIIARTNPLTPKKPSRLGSERWVPAAPPLKGATDGVETPVGEVETVELPPEVVLLVALTNAPPARAGGETVVAFTDAAL